MSENVNQYRHRRKAERDSIFGQLDGYDPMAFYVGSTDKKGHKDPAPRFSVPPGVSMMISNIVASKKFPYANAGELCRDALIHHCQWLVEQSMDPELHREMQRTLARENIDNIHRQVLADIELVERSRAGADIVLRSKDWPGVARLATNLADIIDGLHDPYQSQIMALITELRLALPEQYRSYMEAES